MTKSESGKKPTVKLMFLGGVGDDVTGSSTLVSIEIDGKNRYGLIDVGGYQGTDNRNAYFPVDATKIEFVVITHAHYDHIGLLPKLYKDGFAGKVYITEQARAQGKLILQDAANINLRNSEYSKCGGTKLKTEKRKYEKERKKAVTCRDVKNYDVAISQLDDIIASVLYSLEDVNGLTPLYDVIKPNQLFTIFDGKVFGRFIPTTHQNGAIQFELYYKENNERLGVLFTGDIGPANSLLYESKDGYINTDIEYGVIESLHGVECPKETLEDSISILEKLIKKSIKKGKTIVLSGFSLDRDAMIVYLINKMYAKGARFKAYFDAPLAFSELVCYQNFYKQEYEKRMNSDNTDDLWFKDLGKDPFSLENFEVITKMSEHTQLLNTPGPKVIVTSSANGNGGRVVDFFDRLIQESDAVFVFCGWIYPESPSNILLNTESGQIVDFGYSRYKKNCETIQLHGFSSHGYWSEVFEKFFMYPAMREVILNHGEWEVKEKLEKEIVETFEIGVHIPMLYEAYELSNESIKPLEEVEVSNFFGDVLEEYNMKCVLEEIEKEEEWNYQREWRMSFPFSCIDMAIMLYYKSWD